ncbi:MAG: M14 family metallocarboxypeptidase [Verrucomicrobiaceae bacterium]|nr:M14 family metallocarboxypeptidase [Verrucomicrobiaceae bacterium]
MSPPLQQAHDASELHRRWVSLARRLRLTVSILAEPPGGTPVLALESVAARAGEPAAYLSAGVHGDEAAPPWALLHWAEQHAPQVRDGSFLILPCLNPVGLQQNTRTDERGLDINRRFHLTRDPLARAWQRWITQRRMTIGLCLHEDYDAAGCYVYELGNHRSGLSAGILERMRAVHGRITPDPRSVIDGQRARGGVIRRKKLPTHLPGMPEAIELHLRGCPITLTFETPSELALHDRIDCQHAFIQTALQQLCP